VKTLRCACPVLKNQAFNSFSNSSCRASYFCVLLPRTGDAHGIAAAIHVHFDLVRLLRWQSTSEQRACIAGIERNGGLPSLHWRLLIWHFAVVLAVLLNFQASPMWTGQQGSYCCCQNFLVSVWTMQSHALC
jgi:hypothetical protein